MFRFKLVNQCIEYKNNVTLEERVVKILLVVEFVMSCAVYDIQIINTELALHVLCLNKKPGHLIPISKSPPAKEILVTMLTYSQD